MRKDHKPYALKRLQGVIEQFYVNHYIRPQLDAMGPGGMIMKPWYLKLYGANIRFGEAVHDITARERTVRLTTWSHDDGVGEIAVKDYALLCPGVRIDSASRVEIGSNTMLAAGVYVTDADWHGIYDRPRPIGKTAPVVLEDNVWVGDGAVIGKGVTIGANSIVGAGAVVTKPLPANVIAAGNPAAVVRELDPNESMQRRQDLLADHHTLTRNIDLLEQMLRKDNSWWHYLRTKVAPTQDD
jgi:acetyltransferase-like isoleucine patch superfamily enzyme